MLYKELTMDERNHDVCFRKNEDQRYAIVIMYSVGAGLQPRYVTSQPLKSDTVYPKLQKILNDVEQERMVCLNSHFLNPKNIISVKVDLFKDKFGNKNNEFDGEYYS